MTAVSCPACGSGCPPRSLSCAVCGADLQPFAADFERLSQLGFLEQRLSRWRDENRLPPDLAGSLLASVQQEVESVKARLAPPPPAAPAVELPVPSPAPSVPAEEDRPPPSSRPTRPTPPSPPPPLPPAEPAAAGPAFAWRDVGGYLLSERTLHVLLTLGALLILVSGAVISTLNPTGLSPVAHLLAVVVTALLFFSSGAFVRQKLRLRIAGGALLGIAGAFVPLSVWTLGQEQIMNWAPRSLWLIASSVALPLYVTAHWFLRDRLFALSTAIAAGSEVLAALNSLGLPVVWNLAMVVPLAIGYLYAASRARMRSEELGWGLLWASRVATPLAMVLLLSARFGGDAWFQMFGEAVTARDEYAIGGGWWLGSLYYVLTSRLFGVRSAVYAAAWTIPVAYLLTLAKAPWEAAWHNVCLALLALAYLVAGAARGRHERPDPPPPYRALATRPTVQVSVALSLVAVWWPPQHELSRIATLFVLTVLLFAASALLRRRAPGWLGAVLLPMTFQLQLDYLRDHASLDAPQRMLWWSVLGAALLTLAETLLRRAGEQRRTLAAALLGTRVSRSALASPLMLAGAFACLVALLQGLDQYWIARPLVGVRQMPTLVSGTFVLLLGFLAAWSVVRATGALLYGLVWLALIPITSLFADVLLRFGHVIDEADVARLLAGVAFAYLVLAWFVDRGDGRFARPVYLGGYLLLVASMLVSALDSTGALQVVGFAIAVYAVSSVLVHRGRFPSYERLVVRLVGSGGGPASAVRALFTYLAVGLVPPWTMILTYWLGATLDRYALVLSAQALAFPAIGRWARALPASHRTPWRLVGFALSAIAPVVALPDPATRPVVLAASIVLYAATAILRRGSGWLYPVAVLLPVLMWELLSLFDAFNRWSGIGFVLLGLLYGVVAMGLQRVGGRQPLPEGLGSYALPFLVVGYVLSAVGLARVVNQERSLIVWSFALAVVYYAGSALMLREPLFGWAAAAALAVAYHVGLGLTRLDPAWHGPALLPLALAALGIGEYVRRRYASTGGTPEVAGPSRRDGRPGSLWAVPWYALACVEAVAMPALSYPGQPRITVAWLGSALVFGLAVAFTRSPIWLGPALPTVIVAYLSAGFYLDLAMEPARSAATLAAPAWVLLGLAAAIEWRWPPTLGTWRFVRAATRAALLPDPDERVREEASAATAQARASVIRWTLPLHVAGWTCAALACIGSAPLPQVGLQAALAIAALCALLAAARRDRGLATASLAALVLAYEHWLRRAGIRLDAQPAYWAGAALALQSLAAAARLVRGDRVSVWVEPLQWGSLAIGVGTLVLAPFVQVYPLSRGALDVLAATAGLLGLTIIGRAALLRRRRLFYPGVGLLTVGYLLELMVFEVGQPQMYAAPVGLYVLGIAFTEWRGGAPIRIKRVLEDTGLAVLLVISLVQAVGYLGSGLDRYPYDAFLLVESAILVSAGAALRWRDTFFAGAVAMVVDMGILLIDPLRALDTWYLVALVGLVLIGGVIWIERQRQRIPAIVAAWQARLERWE
ncbi:MAG: hypothetical protein U0821_06305 [Chloroflexota bacterium]